MTTVQRVITITTITCSECGILFGMPDWYVQERREDHRSFFCPNRHSQYFPAKSEAEQAKERAEQLSRELAWANTRALRAREEADHQRRRVSAAKGRETKLKRRIANGVCPCCQRTFKDLSRHMSGQHPDYVAALTAEPSES